jgi:sugar lactone lactonase YvrE
VLRFGRCAWRRFAETGFSDAPGKVYRYTASNGKLDCLISNGINPNRLALSPGESILYFGQDQSKRQPELYK